MADNKTMIDSKTQTFSNWRVPQRFYNPTRETDSPVEEPPVGDVAADIGKIVLEERSTPAPSPVPLTARATPVSKTPTPQKLSRQMSLPDLKLRKTGQRPLGIARQYTRIPDVMRENSMQPQESKAVPTMQAAKNGRQSNGTDDVDIKKEELEFSLQPHVVARAEELMKLAPKAEKKVIEKVLRLAEKKHQIDSTLKKAVLPDARESVEKWLLSANEEERQVALGFFNSLGGSRLMGQKATDQKKRLQQVIDTLEKHGNGNGKTVKCDGEKSKPQRLRFRLMTPNTKRNRWMHTTWHHLPEYPEPKVGNTSSHYTRPQAAIPRHFVIHPDWG